MTASPTPEEALRVVLDAVDFLRLEQTGKVEQFEAATATLRQHLAPQPMEGAWTKEIPDSADVWVTYLSANTWCEPWKVNGKVAKAWSKEDTADCLFRPAEPIPPQPQKDAR